MSTMLERPQELKVHEALAFLITGDLLRKAMGNGPGVEQLGIGFAKFIGSTFTGMPADSNSLFTRVLRFYLEEVAFLTSSTLTSSPSAIVRTEL